MVEIQENSSKCNFQYGFQKCMQGPSWHTVRFVCWDLFLGGRATSGRCLCGHFVRRVVPYRAVQSGVAHRQLRPEYQQSIPVNPPLTRESGSEVRNRITCFLCKMPYNPIKNKNPPLRPKSCSEFPKIVRFLLFNLKFPKISETVLIINLRFSKFSRFLLLMQKTFPKLFGSYY